MTTDTHAAAPSSTLVADQISAFWCDFAAKLNQWQTLERRDFVEAANTVLQRHAPSLSVELEGTPGQAGGRLVITAHGNTEQFESAQALVRQAPQTLPYAVQAFRSRTLGSDFAMRMEDFELACADVMVAPYDAGGIIGLELSFAKGVPQDLQEQAQHMAFILIDHVLGEWDFSVRVGPIDFVLPEDAQASAVPLSVFPPVFDAFQRDVLGRSYDFPQDEDDRWMSLEVRARDADDDAPPDMLTFHDGANALATRADLPYFLTLRFPVASRDEFEAACSAQDALEAELLRLQRGVQAFSRTEAMQSRVAAFYVDDPVYAMQLARQMAAAHAPELEADVVLAYDPAWREFLDMYSAIHQSRAGQDAE